MPNLPARIDTRARSFYLRRLARLLRQRHDYHEDLNDAGLLLLQRAIAATVNDCSDFGAAGQAQEMVDAWEIAQTGNGF